MVNTIIIQGRFTKDPELRYTQSQTPVANFTLAVERDFTDKNGKRECDFIECIAWKSGAEFVNKYFRKGNQAVIKGSLQSRKWTDNNGNNRISWEVIAENIYFCGDKKSDGEQQNKTAHQTAQMTEMEDDDGDLPFD